MEDSLYKTIASSCDADSDEDVSVLISGTAVSAAAAVVPAFAIVVQQIRKASAPDIHLRRFIIFSPFKKIKAGRSLHTTVKPYVTKR